MKPILALIAAAGLAAPIFSQSAPAPPEPLLHIRTSFDLLVHAPLAVAATLFGPQGERAYADKHWDPVFIYPQPASDVEGAVFTVRHGPYNAVWVTSLADIEGRHFQYVYFLEDLMVTVVDVYFKPIGADSTKVNVVYTRTALTAKGKEHVAAMSDNDKTADKDWQQEIDEYLAHNKPQGRP
jgi:hypothetical protein